MPDNFNTAYIASRRERQQPQMDAMLAELDAMSQEPQQGASPVAPAQAPVATPAAPKKESSPGVINEGFKAVAGGVTDAVRNTWNMIDDAATWLDNNFIDLRMDSDTFGQWGGAKAKGGEAHKEAHQIAPLVSDNKTGWGQVTRSITQFVVPFLGATKALKGVQMGGALVKGAAQGAAVDFAAFDPNEKRLSNLVMEMSDGNPAVGKPIFEYLAADPNDSHMEGRLKNTLEGIGLGMATEGLIKGLKATRAHFLAKGENPAQAIEDLSKMAVDTSKAPDMALADQIDLLTGVKRDVPNKFQKRLDVQAAVRDADEAARPKGLELTDEPLQAAAKESNPDAFLNPKRELKLEDPEAIPFKGAEEAPKELTFPEQWKLVEEEAASGKARSAYWDPAESSIIFTKDAPTAGQLPLDLLVKKLEGKPGFEMTAEDKVLANAYKQMQETVLSKIYKPGDELLEAAAKGSDGKIIVEEGIPKKAPTEAPRAVKEAGLDERITKAQERLDAAIEAGKDTTAAQKLLDSLLRKKDAGLFDATTKLTGKQAESLASAGDPLVDAIAANDAAISKAIGRKQSGMITPSMLANLASANVGAITGYLSAEDDATFAERLSLAGVGALAGIGVKVGASKVLKPAERAVIEGAPKEVRAMARPEVQNIAPLPANVKKQPVIHKAKVESLVKAAKEGGMEKLAQAVKESDFNFNHIDTSDEVKATIDAFSEVFEKEASLAKHGTQTFGEIKALADDLGAGVGTLKELYQGTNNLGARILAHRALLTASAEKVTQLSKLAMSGDAEGILALRKQVALHAAIQAQMKGVQTEVGRALAQFRIKSASIDLAINERNSLIEAMGGHDANIVFARKLADITDPKKLNAVIRKSAMARTQDALFEAWVNGLLSGPQTHIVNAIGNSLVAIGSSAERFTAAMYGKILNHGADAVQAGEAKAHLFGMMEGIGDALKITKEGLDSLKRAGGEALTGDFQAAKNTLMESSGEFGSVYRSFAADAPILDNAAYGTREMDLQSAAISAERFGMDQASMMGRLADGLGALIRTPGRMLTSTDELFKTIHYRGELKAQAYRTAVAEGKSGDALFQRVAQLIEDPTPELSAQALQAARTGTFTSPLGKAGQAATQFVNAVPGLRYVVPFMRTPMNIMKYIGERTPGLNALSANVRQEFMAGGARRDMVLAKSTLGGSLYAMGSYLAAQGLITGGGEKDQKAEKLGGWQPYSIKVGDTYYAFNRMDPMGMMLGLAADLTDISGNIGQEEMDQLASAAVLALSRNLVSKSYASGMVDTIEAISNPDTKGEAYIRNFTASWVPAAANTVRKEEDPLVREVWTLTDAVKNRIPGFSKDLPAALNVFGEEVSYKGGLGPDMLSPIATSEATTDPAAAEIARLNIDLQLPAKTIAGGKGGPGIDLTPQQYHRLVKIMGSEVGNGGFKKAMTDLLNDPTYQSLPEDPSNNTYMEAKEATIRKVFERYKRVATMQLLEEEPELKAKWAKERENAGNSLLGILQQ